MTDQIKVELHSVYGTDADIANAAWTSSYEFSKNSRSMDDIKRVINKLAAEKHSVPFESVIFRFWMRLPIATDRQIMTHRIASHSGMSGRYRTMPLEFLELPPDVIAIFDKCPDEAVRDCAIDDYNDLCKEANVTYENTVYYFKDLRDKQVISNDEYKRVREFYRGILPQHNMTERVTIMNLRSWCNFYRLRSKPDAQLEIRQIADSMYTQLLDVKACPIALEALEKNSWQI